MQPSYEITLHPVDLARHGTTPAGLPMWRVVRGETRKKRVMYGGKVLIFPRYDESEMSGGKWVLERWTSAYDLLRMTPLEYDIFMRTMPNAPYEEYPADGDYELAYVFRETIDEPRLHKMLDRHAARILRDTDNDRKIESEAAQEWKKKRDDEAFDNAYEEAREETLNHAS